MDKPIPEGVVLLRDALRIAFRYGETYWQQADSESYAENRRSDETMAKFKSWADETAETLTAAQHPTPRPQGEVALTEQIKRLVRALSDEQARNDRLAEAFRGACDDLRAYGYKTSAAHWENSVTNAAQPGETP